MVIISTMALIGFEGWAHAHEADPELLTGWRIWLHLTIQWAHLIAFALWMGVTFWAFFLTQPRLETLLLSSWALFLVLLATGVYNSEYSSGLPHYPSLLNWHLVSQAPFGRTYTIVLSLKLALFTLAVVGNLAVSMAHILKSPKKVQEKLRQTYLIYSGILAFLISVLVAVLLILHEAADLYPTALHPLGGVLGSSHPAQVGTPGGQTASPDFRIFFHPQVLINTLFRWLHLLGFGLWLGGTALFLTLGSTNYRRFIIFTWILLAVQVLTGLYHMGFSTPFATAPYLFNLEELSNFRFGRTYTLLMGMKQALVVLALTTTAGMTYMAFKNEVKDDKLLVGINLILGLSIAYVIIAILLVHEGVDHVL